ncbi:MAG: hypothetical protein AAF532_08280 [Planctomycetota bacterium]
MVEQSGPLPWDAAAECIGRVAEQVVLRLRNGQAVPAIDASTVLIDDDGTLRLTADSGRQSLDPADDLDALLDRLLGPEETSLPSRFRPLLVAIDSLSLGSGVGVWCSVAAWARPSEQTPPPKNEAVSEETHSPFPSAIVGTIALAAAAAAAGYWAFG